MKGEERVPPYRIGLEEVICIDQHRLDATVRVHNLREVLSRSVLRKEVQLFNTIASHKH